MATAFYIQQVLREHLKESTVITIAHRVEAVKDADYTIMLDSGQVFRCGPIEQDKTNQATEDGFGLNVE
jgi:ABC-type multidrug transport system fused ATPase/permease subunit